MWKTYVIKSKFTLRQGRSYIFTHKRICVHIENDTSDAETELFREKKVNTIITDVLAPCMGRSLIHSADLNPPVWYFVVRLNDTFYLRVYRFVLNSFWASDATWQHISWSILAQVMAWCLMGAISWGKPHLSSTKISLKINHIKFHLNITNEHWRWLVWPNYNIIRPTVIYLIESYGMCWPTFVMIMLTLLTPPLWLRCHMTFDWRLHLRTVIIFYVIFLQVAWHRVGILTATPATDAMTTTDQVGCCYHYSIWWRHSMKTFSALLIFVRGIHRWIPITKGW